MRLTETLALLLVALIVGFGGGCVWEKLGDRDDKAQAIAKVQLANQNTEACATSLLALQMQAQDDIARADEQVEHALRAVENLARENLHMGDALTAAEQRMAEARTEPTCNDQLEIELCPAVPLL